MAAWPQQTTSPLPLPLTLPTFPAPEIVLEGRRSQRSGGESGRYKPARGGTEDGQEEYGARPGRGRSRLEEREAE